jgi:hypothetical protein
VVGCNAQSYALLQGRYIIPKIKILANKKLKENPQKKAGFALLAMRIVRIKREDQEGSKTIATNAE